MPVVSFDRRGHGAMALRTELFQAERFSEGRKVSKQLGLAPRVRASGQMRWEGPILKTGRGRLRALLVNAAWRVVWR